MGYQYWLSTREVEDLYGAAVLAQKTAKAISTWSLEDVEYLNTLANPDALQTSFMEILKNPKLYRPFIPGHLLEQEDDDEPADEVDSP
eukprot:267826_1